MTEIRVKKLEGHYTIKIVDKLPKRGNANWLYAIIKNDTITEGHIWTLDNKFKTISLGAGGSSQNIQEGKNVTITGTGTTTDPLLFNVVPEYNLTQEIELPATSPTGSVVYTRLNNADNSLATSRDVIIPGYLEITRGNGGGAIFNIVTESAWNVPISPERTQWQTGTLDSFNPDSFTDLESALYSGDPSITGFKDIPGITFVVLVQNDGGTFLAEDNVFEITFNTWASGNVGGGLSYTRTSLVPLSSTLTTFGYVVKTFRDSDGEEILANRKFYQNDIEITEPANWVIPNYARRAEFGEVAFSNSYYDLDNIPAIGDVFKEGTPERNQLGIWTGDGSIEGDPGVTIDQTFDYSRKLELGVEDTKSGIITLYAGANNGRDSGIFLYNNGQKNSIVDRWEFSSSAVDNAGDFFIRADGLSVLVLRAGNRTVNTPRADINDIEGEDGKVLVTKEWVESKFQNLNLQNLPTYIDDATAGGAGLVSGDVYMTATGELRVKL